MPMLEINSPDFVQTIDLKLNSEYIVSDVQLKALGQEQKKNNRSL
jgi:hypothetical protein